MNKLTKGAIATAAGIALLLGGAGSFALWNATATVNAGAINSGTMTLTPDSTDPIGVWSDKAGPITNIANYKVVPGATLTFTKKLDIVSTGTNLTATMSLDPASIHPADASAASAALYKALIVTTTIPTLPTGITATAGTANTFAVTGSVGSTTFTVVATIAFPSASDNTTQTGSVDLSKVSFILQQI